MFYLLTGVLALVYTREPFWGVFVVLGAAALMLSLVLGFGAADSARRQVTFGSEPL